jgi:hypothetical protein
MCAVKYFSTHKKKVLRKRDVTLKLRSICFFVLPIATSKCYYLLEHILDDNMDFGHLHVPSREFSEIFQIIDKIFYIYYPTLCCEVIYITIILDNWLSIISYSVEETHQKWSNHVECAARCKNIAYLALAHKDAVWLICKLKYKNVKKINVFEQSKIGNNNTTCL